jgi:hypothetical protein
LFIIFSIYSATSTFYVSFLLTGCGVLICSRNIEKKVIVIILISLALVTSIFFLKETCISKEPDLESVKSIKSDPFKGGLLSAKVKIWDQAILETLFLIQVPKNFSYQNRILNSRKVIRPTPRIMVNSKENPDIFSQVKPSKEVILYDFEVYVRRDNEKKSEFF